MYVYIHMHRAQYCCCQADTGIQCFFVLAFRAHGLPQYCFARKLAHDRLKLMLTLSFKVLQPKAAWVKKNTTVATCCDRVHSENKMTKEIDIN